MLEQSMHTRQFRSKFAINRRENCKQQRTGDRGWRGAEDKQRAPEKLEGLNPAFGLGLGAVGSSSGPVGRVMDLRYISKRVSCVERQV